MDVLVEDRRVLSEDISLGISCKLLDTELFFIIVFTDVRRAIEGRVNAADKMRRLCSHHLWMGPLHMPEKAQGRDSLQACKHALDLTPRSRR